MRKLLMGSSALIALSALAPTLGYAGEAPKVSLSGVTRLAYVIRDEDGPNNLDGGDGGQFQFANAGTEIRLDASGTADNGLTYGVNLDIRPSGGNMTVDEHYIFLQGGWGTVHLGGDDGVFDVMMKGAESVQVGNFGFDVSHTIVTSASVETDIIGLATWAGDTGDDAKISYYTPSFSGFTAGVSIVPDRNSITDPTGTGQFNSNNGTGAGSGGYGDMVQYEAGLNYDGTLGDVSLGLSAAYGYSDAGDTLLEDIEAWNLGGTLGFGDFSLGAGVVDNTDTNVVRGSGGDGQTYYSVGAAYSFGPGAVSTSYFTNEADEDGDGLQSELDIFTVDFEYTVAEGMTAFAQYYTANSIADQGAVTTDTDIDAIVIGTIITY